MPALIPCRIFCKNLNCLFFCHGEAYKHIYKGFLKRLGINNRNVFTRSTLIGLKGAQRTETASVVS